MRSSAGRSATALSSTAPAPSRASAFRGPTSWPNGYDLSINRYKEIVHDEGDYREPREILKDLAALEDEIRQGIADLETML